MSNTNPKNPNRSPFPRGRFLRGQDPRHKVHVLNRKANQDNFRKSNPGGYHHDLGAQDVFLDNFGLFLQEQITPHDWPGYASSLELLMLRWQFLRFHIAPKSPYWGRHYNSNRRQAQAGEPRGLLRWLTDSDLGPSSAEWLEQIGGPVDLIHEQRQLPLLELIREHWGLEDPWDSQLLVSGEHFGPSVQENWPHRLGGVPLPDHLKGPVKNLFLLPPHSATPDLPLRVGCSQADFRLYRQLVRDQGPLGTCTSHAVAVALDLWARRSGQAQVRFSPAWLHCASGNVGSEGRTLVSVVDTLHAGLPCLEDYFPYRDHQSFFSFWRGTPGWKSPQRETNSRDITFRLGRPRIDKLNVRDIATLKAYLAAGWPVVVTTGFPHSLLTPGFLHHGLGLQPYPGQSRLPSGHAWLLVGYDHVDGNQWKYQGSFLTLNSWGAGFPKHPHRAETAGLCYLPFALLYNEGIEAYALVGSRYPRLR